VFTTGGITTGGVETGGRATGGGWLTTVAGGIPVDDDGSISSYRESFPDNDVV